MSAHRIECPHCAQHVSCDESYSGKKIQCPGCGREMVIPPLDPADTDSNTSVVASVPSAPTASRVVVRPTVAAPPPAAPPSPTPAAVPTSGRLAVSVGARTPMPQPHAPMPGRPHEKGSAPSRSRSLLVVVLLVVIGVPAVYFVFQWAAATQRKFNEARANDDDPGVIGGQVSHIMELNQVLDATDPARHSQAPNPGAETGGAIGRARKARSALVNASGAAMAEDVDSLPVKPAAWSLDAATAEIPESRICGTISKSDFVADDSWLITGSSRPVLMFSQGESFANPDLGLLVYLRLKPGESLENRTWMISQEQKSGVPQVIKRWKAGAPARLQQRTFTGGYAMRLEFGKAADGVIPGRFYIALPDPEQSVVSGHFQAVIRIPAATSGGAPSAGQGASPGIE